MNSNVWMHTLVALLKRHPKEKNNNNNPLSLKSTLRCEQRCCLFFLITAKTHTHNNNKYHDSLSLASEPLVHSSKQASHTSLSASHYLDEKWRL